MRRALFVCPVVAVCLFMALGAAAAAERVRSPGRNIDLAFQFFDVTVSRDALAETVSFDLMIRNTGSQDEQVVVSVSEAPEGWDGFVSTYAFDRVRGVSVPAEESRSVKFEVKAPPQVPDEPVRFVVRAETVDGRVSAEKTLTIRPAQGAVARNQVEVSTPYPVLSGTADTRFEFTLDVQNRTGEDQTFAFSAQVPANWRAGFRPAYEDLTISSLRLAANESKSVRLQVTPDRLADAGRYPVSAVVSAGSARSEVSLSVVITGTYSLEMRTLTGVLSLETKKGDAAGLSIYVKNTGSAANHGVEFMSVKPENWEVVFEPAALDVIEPGEVKQVEVTVTPAADALVGDYSVGLATSGERADDDMELRVTVRPRAVWAWVGVGLIILVLAGLALVFVRMGRR